MVRLRHWFVGRSCVSMPFLNYGGVCADNGEVERLLIDEAIRIAKREKVDYLEVRQLKRIDGPVAPSLDKVMMFRELGPQSELMLKNLHKKVRYKIRRAEENGLKFQIHGAEALSEYYEIFARGQHALGTPVFSRSFFQSIFENFTHDMKIGLVTRGGRTVAGAVVGTFKETVDGLWACSTPEDQHLYPNEFLYWKFIEYAADGGFKSFNFGRSSNNSGSFAFKTKFGAQPEQLYVYRYPIEKTPPSGTRAQKWQYRVAGELWRRAPLRLTQAIGPYLRKYLSE